MRQQEQIAFSLNNAYHPLLKTPVSTTFFIEQPAHLAFLTGVNTSGKTTFLKTVGLIVYMAHLGLAVPAEEAVIPFFDALYTSIHLRDDLLAGHSHFYGEVLKIGEVADSLASGKRTLLIYDELFRGTNPQDAYSCSQEVIRGFLRYTSSLFFISSHLYELADSFTNEPGVTPYCFRTSINENCFTNTYQIEPGVANERVGLLLVKQLGVLKRLHGY